MKAVWKGIILVGLVAVGAAFWMNYKSDEYPGHPLLGSAMLYKDVNPVPMPKRVQIFSTLQEGDRDRMKSVRTQRKKWLRYESRDERAIGELVTAMREGARKDMRPPLKDGVTYHIYFETADSLAPLYYMFFYRTKANEPSALTAYTTVGNLCDAEAVERWFERNGILGVMAKE